MRMPAKSHNDPATLEQIDEKGDEPIGAPEQPPTARVL